VIAQRRGVAVILFGLVFIGAALWMVSSRRNSSIPVEPGSFSGRISHELAARFEALESLQRASEIHVPSLGSAVSVAGDGRSPCPF